MDPWFPESDISHKFDKDDEHGSIEQNAIAKAVALSATIGDGRLSIASDGGLLVPALGDAWNPAKTRRFAGNAADDVERALRLLAMTALLVEPGQRTIGWWETVAIAANGELLGSWSAESVSGVLATNVDPSRVADGGGFWIPALWRCPEYGCRLLAELTPDERAARDDHWRRLAGPVLEWLRTRGDSTGGR